METLLAVAAREFEAVLEKKMATPHAQHIVHLLCSLQTSLMTWFYKMVESEAGKSDVTLQNIVSDCELCN